MVPKTAKSKRTHERVLREAAQLFSVKGYYATSVEDVMARVGLTKGGFYAHFASKEELGRAVIEHAAEVWFERVVAHVQRFSDPRVQLRELLEAYRLYATSRTFEGGCFFVNLAVEMDDQHQDFRRLVAERFDQFRAMVATLVEGGKALGLYRDDAPSEAIGIAVVAYLTGTMMLSKSAGTFSLFDEANPLIVELLASHETSPPPAAASQE